MIKFIDTWSILSNIYLVSEFANVTTFVDSSDYSKRENICFETWHVTGY